MNVSPQERRLVVYALHFLASNLDQTDLENLGLAEPKSTADNEGIPLSDKADELCAVLAKLAERFERQ